MLNDTATFDTHGDTLESYGVLPIGYAFLADDGFYFRATIGPVIDRERVDTTASMPLQAPMYDHKLVIGGPFFNVAAGVAF